MPIEYEDHFYTFYCFFIISHLKSIWVNLHLYCTSISNSNTSAISLSQCFENGTELFDLIG